MWNGWLHGTPYISIHAPAKGATPSKTMCPSFNSFQSTLPRRERPTKIYDPNNEFDISIHAPAKGATKGDTTELKEYADFNPRSREGSDRIARKSPMCIHYFNPRSREGSDRINTGRFALSQISIHAPAKGATSSHVCVSVILPFQSTLPRRERPNRVDIFDIPF